MNRHIAKNVENIILIAHSEMDVLYEEAKCGRIEPDRVSEKIEDIMIKSNSKILGQHAMYCGIWQSKDGKHWRTKVPTDKDCSGSKLMSYTTKENLEKAIIKHYKSMYKKSQTLTDVHTKWREQRMKLALASKDASSKLATLNKHDNIWARYFESSNLVKQDITKITTGKLVDWLIDSNLNYRFSARQFKEVKALLNLLFTYAVEHDIVMINVAKQISKIDGLSFREDCKNAEISELQRIEQTVYTAENEEYLIRKAYEKYEHSGNTAYLAIIMNTKLGLRVGEIVALREGDILGNSMHVCREEVAKRVVDKDGRIHRDGFEVVAHTKTAEGDRYMPLTPDCKMIIGKIIDANAKNGFRAENGYLFINKKGERMHENSINNALAELNGGRQKVNTDIKEHRPHGNHSIRKTYLSKLHNCNVPDEALRGLAGHTDINTTRRNYFMPVNTLESHLDDLTRILDA